MPNVKIEKVEPRFDGGPKLWHVRVLWDADQVLGAYGEKLSDALGRLAGRVRAMEASEIQAAAFAERRGEEVA